LKKIDPFKFKRQTVDGNLTDTPLFQFQRLFQVQNAVFLKVVS